MKQEHLMDSDDEKREGEQGYANNEQNYLTTKLLTIQMAYEF